MTATRRDSIRALLKGIETGDPSSVEVIHPEVYIQHNPQTREGRAGLAALFKRLAETSPKVNIVRIFSDGDYVFGHTEYDFATRRIGFEVFRFEGALAVEHWDNIQPRRGPNPAGRSMVDGPTDATDHECTEANRATVRAFVEEALIAGHGECWERCVDPALIQHDPDLGDGEAAWRDAMRAEAEGAPLRDYQHLHRVLAEGNFALTVTEGAKAGVHTAFYDLFRLAEGRIVERWNTVEAVALPEEWQNDNGKF